MDIQDRHRGSPRSPRTYGYLSKKRYGHLSRQCPEARSKNQEPAASTGTKPTTQNLEGTRNLEDFAMSEGLTVPKIMHGDWIIVKKNMKPKILTKSKEDRGFLDTGRLDSGRGFTQGRSGLSANEEKGPTSSKTRSFYSKRPCNSMPLGPTCSPMEGLASKSFANQDTSGVMQPHALARDT
ncbi:hypothetical protein RJT34_20393 [Clitoria ternatea]|uniref:Uncharacterized protein n=1 Tax=Clitoria ternatea TaxID=43366 RepID=A0AAN9P556_CLITE